MQADKDILRFDIAVHVVLGMEVLQRARHLGNIHRGLGFGELLCFAEVFVQLALAGEFEDEEDAFVVVEVAV